MSDQSKQSRWFPNSSQLKDPSSLERSFRQLLNQHYALQDAHDKLLTRVNSMAAPADSPTPAGSGPTDSMLLGLRVLPVDSNTLADGATLKFVKAQGILRFS